MNNKYFPIFLIVLFFVVYGLVSEMEYNELRTSETEGLWNDRARCVAFSTGQPLPVVEIGASIHLGESHE